MPFLRSHGIRCDESSGFADRIGYRNGIGGCFQFYDVSADRPLDILEMPLIVMDAVLIDQYGSEGVDVFGKMLEHLGHVGGALSVVFHPGQFNNPEHKRMLGVYHGMLVKAREAGARSMTARALADAIFA